MPFRVAIPFLPRLTDLANRLVMPSSYRCCYKLRASPTPSLFNLKFILCGVLTAALVTLLCLKPAISEYSHSEMTGLLNLNFKLPSCASKSTGMAKGRTPVYFLGHGGPNIMFDTEHPAHKKLQEIGKEITTAVKPKAIVVFSAHWAGERDVIEVNTSENADLIYDFYGFPSHYYKEKYPNVGSKEISGKVIAALKGAGIKVNSTKRGLDHGVWVSFKCAFHPEENPLNVPIVQVSLYDTEDPVQHYKLGQAISALRDENIQIIVAGMAVHNLRDMRFAFGGDLRPMPYCTSFDEALKEAATQPPAQREKAMVELLKRPDAREAHPSFDHLLPIHIGAGAAGDDMGERLWTLKEGSISWAMYRFGQVPAN